MSAHLVPSSHDGTNSHRQLRQGDQAFSSEEPGIYQMNKPPQTEPTVLPSISEFAINGYGDDSKGEANKLLAKCSHELPNDKEAHTSTRETTRVKRLPPTKQIFLSWWPEIAWCIFTTGLLIALAAILKSYDKQPAPQWPVSLNTVIAAVSTICRASMVIPISEGLSQLKWNAFARSQRPLIDLQTFDRASRGPFGSLILLSKTRGRLLSVSTIAALILISSLATSSLTQATIASAPPLRKITEDATMTKANAITLDDWHKLDDPLRSAAFQAFFIGARERESLQLQPRCPSSCHWDKFRSIDVCDMERNVTEKLNLDLQDPDDLDGFDLVQPVDPEEQIEYWRVTLVSNRYSSCQVDDINSFNWVCATNSTNTDGAKDLWGDDMDEFPETTLTTQLFIYKKLPYPGEQVVRSYKGDKSPYRAVAVTWYWCIKEYEVDVTRGTTHIKATETNFNVVNDSWSITDRTFTLVDTLSSERFPVALGNWGLGVGGKIEPMGRANDGLISVAMGRIIGNVTTTEDDPWDNIMTWKKDATLAMSALVRSYGTDDSNIVRGYSEIGQATVIIRWGWLSLLVTQVALMVVFMVYVIFETAHTNVKVVKGSNIAELKAIRTQMFNAELEQLLVGGIAAKIDAELVGRLVQTDDGDWSLEVDRRAACQTL